MLPNLPPFIPVLFLLIIVLTIGLCYNYLKGSGSAIIKRRIGAIIGIQIIWLIIQGILAYKGFYTARLSLSPPRLFIFGLLPPLIVIIIIFCTKVGRKFIDDLPLKGLLLLNLIRIPVEVGLFLLYLHGAVPRLMTFEGGNLDILSGISALIIIYIGFDANGFRHNVLFVWNSLCLALLVNIVVRALLSAPFPMQKLAFSQPNVAILYFPFVLLPTFIVPLVLFGHLVVFRKIFKTKHKYI
jgi:hypothetical protein